MGDAAVVNVDGVDPTEEEVELTLSDKLQHAPEMRLIGRRIRMRMDGFAFEGFVTYVTKTTVVLMDCEKLTFEQQELREQVQESVTRQRRETRRRERARRSRRTVGNASVVAEPAQPTPSGDAHMSASDGEAAASGDVDPPPQPATTTTPTATHHDPFAEDGDEAASLPRIGESVGADDEPLENQLKSNVAEYPFCTFIRRRIHDVRLMPHTDPEPTSAVPPPQLLRACVRRYIIHGSLGNTSRITLDGFLRRRLGWRDIDPEITTALHEEELKTVNAVADEISKDRLSALRAAAAANRRPIGPPRADENRRNAPFGDTEHMTEAELARAPFIAVNLHTKAMYAAIMHLIFAMISLLYAASVFSTAESAVVSSFLGGFTTWVAGAATVQLVEAAVVGLHSLRMVVPVPCKLMVVRVVVLIACTGVLAVAIYVSSVSVFTFDNPFGRSTEEIYVTQVRESPQVICSYAATRKCGGWDELCESTTFDTTYCPSSCSAVVIRRGQTCKGPIHSEIENIVIPSCVFMYITAVILIFDIWCLVRFFMVAADPVGTLERAQRDAPEDDDDDFGPN